MPNKLQVKCQNLEPLFPTEGVNSSTWLGIIRKSKTTLLSQSLRMFDRFELGNVSDEVTFIKIRAVAYTIFLHRTYF